MKRLIEELQRLFLWPGQEVPGLAPCLAGRGTARLEQVDEAGRVRLLVLEFSRGGDWEAAARLYGALQQELELPPPALAVSARAGFQLWFSLAVPVPVAEARRFLEGLRCRYLADLVPDRLRDFAGQQGAAPLELVPACDPSSGKWSAFIDPGLGAMFAAEAGLDMAPGLEQQADLLKAFTPVPLADFRRVLDGLAQTGADPGEAGPGAGPRPQYRDPGAFLLDVMNDPGVRMRDRIRAARALLHASVAEDGRG